MPFDFVDLNSSGCAIYKGSHLADKFVAVHNADKHPLVPPRTSDWSSRFCFLPS
jgi:hypothetical protein